MVGLSPTLSKWKYLGMRECRNREWSYRCFWTLFPCLRKRKGVPDTPGVKGSITVLCEALDPRVMLQGTWNCSEASSPDFQEVIVSYSFPDQVIAHTAPSFLTFPEEDDIGLYLFCHALHRGIGGLHVSFTQPVLSPIW